MYEKNDELRDKTFNNFLKRYSDIPYLIIFKTVDFSRNLGKAFDNLEGFEHEYPLVFNFDDEKWETTVLIESEIKQGNIR